MSDLKILVVEDEPITLRILEKRLKVAGYEVETAVDGVKGHSRMETN